MSGTIPTPEAPPSGEAAPDDDPTIRARSSKLTKRELALITGISLVIAFAVAIAAVTLTNRGSDDEPVPIDDFLSQDDPGQAAGAPEVGDFVPNLDLELFDGTTTTLNALLDRPMVVNVWASTCTPCLREMPDFEAVHQDLGEQVGMLGIDSGETQAQGQPFAEKVGVTYPLAEDPKLVNSTALGLNALPMTLFINADGTLAHRQLGAMSEDALRSNIEKHLGVAS